MGLAIVINRLVWPFNCILNKIKFGKVDTKKTKGVIFQPQTGHEKCIECGMASEPVFDSQLKVAFKCGPCVERYNVFDELQPTLPHAGPLDRRPKRIS